MRRFTVAAGATAALAMFAVLGFGFLAGSDSANSSTVEFDNDGDGCSDLEELGSDISGVSGQYGHNCHAKAMFPQFLTDMTRLASLEDLAQLILVDFRSVLERQVALGLGGGVPFTQGEEVGNGGIVECVYPDGSVSILVSSYTGPLTAPMASPASDNDVLEEEENEHVPAC